MIGVLSEWAKNLCLSLVVVSILEMILPNNKTKKYINVVMGLYILFNIFSPIISNLSNIDLNNVENYINNTIEETNTVTSSIEQNSIDMQNADTFQNSISIQNINKNSTNNQTLSDAENSMNTRLAQLYSEQLENDITKKLENKGYLVNSCKVKCNFNEKNADIEKIVIKVLKSKDKEISDEISNYDRNSTNNGTEEENSSNEESGFENKLVTEIQNIKRVNVKISDDEEKSEEAKRITSEDAFNIKKFITNEYGVDEKCIKIN